MACSELDLHLARPTDAYAIAHLSRELIEYGLHWRWRPRRVAASIRAPNVNVLVARILGSIVGFAIMRYGDDDAHLELLGVTTPYQCTGIGGRLVHWLEECAIVAGIFRVTLEVREENMAARCFYRRMGYRTLARLPGYYQGIEAAVRMGRNLSSHSLDHGIDAAQYWSPKR